jgi:hypothetical protein
VWTPEARAVRSQERLYALVAEQPRALVAAVGSAE